MYQRDCIGTHLAREMCLSGSELIVLDCNFISIHRFTRRVFWTCRLYFETESHAATSNQSVLFRSGSSPVLQRQSGALYLME